MQQNQATLDVIYENWREYNARLRTAIAPLTDEQSSCNLPRRCGRWIRLCSTSSV